MKIFHAVASLQASYGGPARSVPSLAAALNRCGCEATVWAADGSAGPQAGGADVIHDHGIWLPHNWRLSGTARRLKIPRIVSPRGMLEPWAMHHKRWKKRLAWLLYQRRCLASAGCIHATSEAEAEGIGRLRLGVPVCMIPNGVDLPDRMPEEYPPRESSRRVALFLGRIYPVKGLPMLVEAWSRIRPHGWVVEVAGPDEGGHQKEVERLIRHAGLEDQFRFTGLLEGRRKQEAFAGAELFILPTHSENFGMAVAEALASAVPVLTTTAAPWPLLEEKGCGWRVAPTPDAIAAGLAQATDLDSATLRNMGETGRELVGRSFSWNAAAEAMASVYRWLLGNGPRPPVVR